ncbi:uncharacterized protein LOC125764113 isoform X2 [Anopheles funestus]|uniref:uncharacterized protein LOC125764113 isoform X2 n=1 Tax=Anopheles funestus TaxID=62324 RepID=UPI0020C696C9|nr:uncharacterized protein LOC125764113 isoform X2 [Anopheles funestus]
MAKQVIGTVQPYVFGEEIENYLERVDLFLEVNDVEDDKKTGFLLTIGGAELFDVARKVCSPKNPKEIKYDVLTKTLTSHLKRSTNEVAERYKFRLVFQKELSINEYIIELKAAAQLCNFESFLEKALRDQLVAGVTDQELRKRLLSKSMLTYESACNVALSWEAAKRQNDEMNPNETQKEIATVRTKATSTPARSASEEQDECRQAEMAALRRTKWNNYSPAARGERNRVSRSTRSVLCYRCGRQHDPNQCPVKAWNCYACGKTGHVASCCRSNRKGMRAFEEEQEEEGVEHMEMYD